MNLQQSRQDLNVGVLKIKCAFRNSSTAVSFSEVSGDIIHLNVVSLPVMLSMD